MIEDQLAVISDIHGNRWALTEVLEDIDRRGILDVVNLGDSFYGPLDPASTADMLLWLNKTTVRGNEDRVIVEASHGYEESPTLRFVIESLSAEHVHWLERLKMTAVAYEDFFLCHGSLERDDEYLLEQVRDEGVFLRKSSELSAMLASVQQPVLLCGHDHVPRTVYLPDGKLIVNPGSVGLPAYTEYFPVPHVMESGSPHARYSVLSKTEKGWRVENIAVPYDWESAAAAATENGRPDWAEWLRTGRAVTA